MLCPELATAVLLFDARVTTAWLVDAPSRTWRGMPICSVHANRFRPPVGWVLSDQRSQTARQKPKGAGFSGSQPELDDADPVESSVPSDSEAASEPAETPLLSRAFRTTAQVGN